MGIPYTKSDTTLSVVIDFRPTIIPSSHPNFQKLCELVENPRTTEADITPLINIPKAIETFTGGNVTVINGRLFYKGFEVKNNLASVILNFVKQGKDAAAKPFEMFMEKAHQNPDPRAVEGLYDWVVAGKLPITPDGDILAWKIVQNDYYSKRSGKQGKLRHAIGDVVEEPRHETDPDPDRTCSIGIHFCSLEYIEKGNYGSMDSGDRIVAVAISPTDVVAFPRDYKLSKGRCCRLKVVGEVDWQKVKTFYDDKPVYSGWEPPKAERNAHGIAVGQTWRRRDGSKVVIESISHPGAYPVRDTDGSTYTSNGDWDGPSSDSKFDLLSLVKDVD